MSKRGNLERNCKPVVFPVKTKCNRDCRCFKEYQQLKSDLTVLQKSYGDGLNHPEVRKENKIKERECQQENLPVIRNKNKTWLEVLRENPNQNKNKKQLHVNQNEPVVRRSNPEVLSKLDKPDKNLLQNTNSRPFSSFFDDEHFLEKLIQFNRILQLFCVQSNMDEYYASQSHNMMSKNSRNRQTSIFNRITQGIDSRYNLQRSSSTKEPFTYESKENEDIQVKALVKVLQNMQSINKNSERQSDSIETLTQSITQLLKENKKLNQLNKIRIELESKLASLSTENTYLKKQLQSSEEERDKANRLLQIKENDINVLKKEISSIRVQIAGKMDSGINYDISETSLELNNLNDTIASLPTNNRSFDALIRPASSSPTEEVMEKWKDSNLVRRPEDDDSGIQSNPLENNQLKNHNVQSAIRVQALSELNENIKKTVQQFQSDLELNDLSLNLSDTTYKLSLSSLV